MTRSKPRTIGKALAVAEQGEDRPLMLQGLGIDIVEVARIKKALGRWGDRFLRRVFQGGAGLLQKESPSGAIPGGPICRQRGRPEGPGHRPLPGHKMDRCGGGEYRKRQAGGEAGRENHPPGRKQEGSSHHLPHEGIGHRPGGSGGRWPGDSERPEPSLGRTLSPITPYQLYTLQTVYSDVRQAVAAAVLLPSWDFG